VAILPNAAHASDKPPTGISRSLDRPIDCACRDLADPGRCPRPPAAGRGVTFAVNYIGDGFR